MSGFGSQQSPFITAPQALTKEFKTSFPWEMLNIDDLVLIIKSVAEIRKIPSVETKAVIKRPRN